MLISQDVEKIEGIEHVMVGMGTDTNKSFLVDLDMLTEEIKKATPNDLVIAIKGTEKAIENALSEIDKKLNKKADSSKSEEKPYSIEGALEKYPDINMAVISVAGEFAGAETKKALDKNLHVMLFSDNVSIEEEIELKKYAASKDLLVMGPDCGTAIINGIGLAFANKVNRGKIGIVAASGTGAQEVSSIISNLGSGISQLIGTGGRDVKEDVGGIMFLQGIKYLLEDDETEIIVLVSKPPVQSVVEKAMEILRNGDKKAVVHFIKGKAEGDGEKIFVGNNLEDTAIKAHLLASGKIPENKTYSFFETTDKEFDYSKIVEEEIGKLKSGAKYLRGLYSGGTLADESMVLLSKTLNPIWSNIPVDPKFKLKDVKNSVEHTVIDMGDDEFTVGRPHPMIDFTLRKDRLIKEYKDPEVALVLLDVVLGFGSNMDPAGEIAEAMEKVKNDPHTTVVATICGTYNDYQEYEKQVKTLEKAGVIVFPTNASAVKFVSEFMGRL
jgi:succinyl-CoA synthetase alpha subunit